MATLVVNVKHTKDFDVYIGRPMRQIAKTIPGSDGRFGNPFKEGYKNNLQPFWDYLQYRMEVDPRFRADILALKDKRLGCWCAPKRCHGNVIARFLDGPPEGWVPLPD